MIQAASFPEAHRNRYLLPEYPAVYLETYITNLIADFREIKTDEDGGQALFAEYGEGVALTHAHPVDQWQIYLQGVARLGHKPVAPVVIQYTDAWIPYGPIEVAKEGFALIALWPRPNLETYEMPKDVALIRDNLRGQPHRHLYRQIDVCDAAPATLSQTSLIEGADVWARRWQLPAETSFVTPDPSKGGGQFFIPLAGSIHFDGREYPRWSAIYVGPHDSSIRLRAGANGADIIGMEFRPQDQIQSTQKVVLPGSALPLL
jgi:hypothetical protein